MAEPNLSQQEAIRALMDRVAKRLQRGEKAEAVRAGLIARGLSPAVTDNLLAGFAPGRWERGVRSGALRGCGVVIALAGSFLWLGNQIGFFPIFPFAGT